MLFLVGNTPAMVVTSGAMKTIPGRLKQLLGIPAKVRMAGAAATLELTGYPPGGVCPFALPRPLPVLIDRSMERFPVGQG